MHDSKSNHSVVKRDVSSRKANNDAAKGNATLKHPNWYEKAELSISAQRPSTKSRSQKIQNVWSMRKIRGF